MRIYYSYQSRDDLSARGEQKLERTLRIVCNGCECDHVRRLFRVVVRTPLNSRDPIEFSNTILICLLSHLFQSVPDFVKASHASSRVPSVTVAYVNGTWGISANLSRRN